MTFPAAALLFQAAAVAADPFGSPGFRLLRVLGTIVFSVLVIWLVIRIWNKE